MRGGGGEGTRVIVDGASFSWGAESGDTQVLTDISLDFAPGSLTMVVGTVASGKTTLLNALLGELTKVAGSVTLIQPVASSAPVTAELQLGVGDSSLDLDPPPRHHHPLQPTLHMRRSLPSSSTPLFVRISFTIPPLTTRGIKRCWRRRH